jgi:membrane associated rhomboid family serine protease
VFLKVVLWLVIACAAFVGVILVVLLVHPEHPDNRLGAVILLVPVAAAIAGAVWGLRRLKQRPAPAGASPARETFATPVAAASGSPELAETRRRVLQGETVVLHPSRRRTILLGSVCLLLFGGSVAGFVATPHVLFAVGVVFFGFVTALWGMRLVPGRMDLRIAPDGLVVGGAFKRTTWAWNQIAAFEAYEIYGPYGSTTKLVGFERRDVDHARQNFWKTMGRGMSGVDESLPDTYGLPHDELAELLQTARDRYATESGPSPADRAILEEAAHVRQDRLPLVTAALTIGCIAVFVLEVSRYGLFPNGQELYDAGAASRDALAAGRWWTLLAANVLHGGPIHIFLNLTALVFVGWLLEREIGAPKLALLCVVGGLAATGVAILIRPHTEVVGVSGVIFAMLGWAVVRDRLRTRALGAVAWGTLVPGVIYTFLLPHVSIGAHAGGLAAGVVLGRLFERRLRAGDRAPAAGTPQRSVSAGLRP